MSSSIVSVWLLYNVITRWYIDKTESTNDFVRKRFIELNVNTVAPFVIVKILMNALQQIVFLSGLWLDTCCCHFLDAAVTSYPCCAHGKVCIYDLLLRLFVFIPLLNIQCPKAFGFLNKEEEHFQSCEFCKELKRIRGGISILMKYS